MYTQDSRKKIINVVMKMIEEVDDLEKITVRQVADKADVGIGLINYHFESKNKLLSIAIADYMAKMATGFVAQEYSNNLNPIDRIKIMLKSLYSFGEKHEKLIKFTITQNLINGEMQTPLFLVPILKEIFGEGRDEFHSRIIALQILLPIQVASINPKEFQLYSGINLNDEKQRNEFIDKLVNNVIVREVQKQ